MRSSKVVGLLLACSAIALAGLNTDVPPGAEDAIRNARAAVDAGKPLSFDLAPIIQAAEAKDKRNHKQ